MISAVLPLVTSANGYDGWNDDQTIEAVKQNLHFLMLTRPGEYVMASNFGVGLPNYLFNLDTTFPETEVRSRIHAQVGEYMPYVEIKNLTFSLENIDGNQLGIRLEYSINQSILTEVFELTVTL